jgi:AraC-like DNA-binding protein
MGMLKRNLPGVDRAIQPQNGFTRDGQPLSYNRAPAPDLEPWIARLYVSAVDTPVGHRMECGLFNDTSLFRIQARGKWTAETRDGLMQHERSALFFGPQSRRMPVSVTNSFISVGISMRPGSGHALVRANTADFVDRLVPSDDWGLPGDLAMAVLDQDATQDEWLCGLEELVRRIVERADGAQPDPIATRFEYVSLADPTTNIADFANDCGIEQRRLERMIRRDFGLPPKQVLRRARALDMASHLRGVADFEEAEELMLRYYDQSHYIREMNELFGMSPRQFIETPQPILTLALESRQARRLEALERLTPGQQRPWENARG